MQQYIAIAILIGLAVFIFLGLVAGDNSLYGKDIDQADNVITYLNEKN